VKLMPKLPPPECKIALSAMQAASALGCGHAAIYDALRKRELIARQIGARRLIAVQDLLAWFYDQPEAKPSAPDATENEVENSETDE
jgi:hypothetical protein